MGGVQFDMRGARAKLQRIVDGLKRAASGEVVERAAAAVEAQIAAVSRDKLAKRTDTGAAAAATQATHSGGLVQLKSKGYLRYHRWWPFRGGKMPPFVIKSATRIFAVELRAATQGKDPDAVSIEAAGVLAAAEAAETKKADAAYERRVKRQEAQEGRGARRRR
jgi:hypothetical protein